MTVGLSVPVTAPDKFAMPVFVFRLRKRNVPIAPLSNVSVGASKHSFGRGKG